MYIFHPYTTTIKKEGLDFFCWIFVPSSDFSEHGTCFLGAVVASTVYPVTLRSWMYPRSSDFSEHGKVWDTTHPD
jgi:hypothetical protein